MKNGEKKDDYFIYLFDKASQQAREKVGDELTIDDINIKLLQVLAQQINYGTLKPTRLAKMNEAVRNWAFTAKNDSLENNVKGAAIQQALINYTLKEDNQGTPQEKWKIQNLLASCHNYQRHLQQQITASSNQPFSEQIRANTATIIDPCLKSAIKKHLVVDKLIDTLMTNNLNDSTRLSNFESEFNRKKHSLAKNRDYPTMAFLKDIIHFLTFGLVTKLGLFASRGCKTNCHIEEVLNPTLAMAMA
jgi:hypothetical protein